MMLATTLPHLPPEQELLRGRLLAVYTVFTSREANIEGSRNSAYASWDLLYETEYQWDAVSAMCHLAITEAAMGDHKQAFAVLDVLEQVERRPGITPNRHIETMLSSARPIALSTKWRTLHPCNAGTLFICFAP